MRAALCLAIGLLAALASAQMYPWGPETQWTRAAWSESKLPFPFGKLRTPALDEGCTLHSANGPFNLQYYRSIDKQQASRGRRRPLPAVPDRAAVIRCTVCNLVIATAWESARRQLHETGEIPDRKRLELLLSSACETEVPATVEVVAALSDQFIQYPEFAAPEMTSLFSGMNREQATKICQEILKTSTKAQPLDKLRIGAMHKSLRDYTAQLNAEMFPLSKQKRSGERHEANACLDLHSECRKWAARGECEKNPNYMLGVVTKNAKFEGGHCRFSCGLCLARLPSGEFPEAASWSQISLNWIDEAQQTACNASGICGRVAASAVPKVMTLPLGTKAASAAATIKQLLDRKLPGGLAGGESPALLNLRKAVAALPKQQCYFQNLGWWSYELCPGQQITQFHVDVDANKIEQLTVLGTYHPENQPSQKADQLLEPRLSPPAEHSSRLPYYKQRFTGGDECLLEPEGVEVKREAEARLACSPDSNTYLLVDEPDQCQYLLTLYSPLLCTTETGKNSGSPAGFALAIPVEV